MAVGTRISLKDSIATRMLLVILGLYLLVAMTITLSHVLVEYKYQKENIIQDLEDIEQAFENGLAVSPFSKACSISSRSWMIFS
ncbi:MAG: hypothetical protein DRH26_12065, partial [Deltaproteobacteria bacterium]